MLCVCTEWNEKDWHHLSLRKILHMDCSGEFLHETMIAIESGALQICSPVKGAVCYAKEEMQGGSVPVVAKVRI